MYLQPQVGSLIPQTNPLARGLMYWYMANHTGDAYTDYLGRSPDLLPNSANGVVVNNSLYGRGIDIAGSATKIYRSPESLLKQSIYSRFNPSITYPVAGPTGCTHIYIFRASSTTAGWLGSLWIDTNAGQRVAWDVGGAISAYSYNGGAASQMITTSSALNVGEDYVLAWVQPPESLIAGNAGLMELYINGDRVPFGITYNTGGSFSDTNTMYIHIGGRFMGGTYQNPFHGVIQAHALYNRALSLPEIRALTDPYSIFQRQPAPVSIPVLSKNRMMYYNRRRM